MISRPGVGFDFGHTLIEIGYPNAGLRRAGEGLAASLGVPEPSLPAAEVGPTIDAAVDRLISARHRADPLREVKIVEIYRMALVEVLGVAATPAQAELACAELQRPWRDQVVLRAGALETLAALREQGAPVGLLSNAPYPAPAMHRMLERSGLAQHLTVALFSSELGLRKPAAGAFQALARGLGLEPAEVWFVGDEWESDILGASAAGLRPWLAPGAGPSPDPALAPELGSFAELVGRWRRAAGRATTG